MSAAIMMDGAEAGTRWARELLAAQNTEHLLGALDRMFEADSWEPQLIYANLVRMRCVRTSGDTARIRVGTSDATALDWWRETGGSRWPATNPDRASFVKGFIIGAALEMRNSLLV